MGAGKDEPQARRSKGRLGRGAKSCGYWETKGQTGPTWGPTRAQLVRRSRERRKKVTWRLTGHRGLTGHNARRCGAAQKMAHAIF